MNQPAADRAPVLLPRVWWFLIAALALHCWGLADWTLRGETPLAAGLRHDALWPEASVRQIEQASVWAFRVMAVALPLLATLYFSAQSIRWRLAGGVLLWCTAAVTGLWQLALTMAKWWRDPPFAPAESWGRAEELFLAVSPLGEQSSRYAVPLALVLVLPALSRLSRRRAETALSLLRLATAATFLGHGYKALRGSGQFVTLLTAAAQNLLGVDLSPDTAETILVMIGIQDLVLAALILARRWPAVAAYMAAWGAVTAASRIVHGGWGAYPETLIRLANAAVPLALYLAWRCPPEDSPTSLQATN